MARRGTAVRLPHTLVGTFRTLVWILLVAPSLGYGGEENERHRSKAVSSRQFPFGGGAGFNSQSSNSQYGSSNYGQLSSALSSQNSFSGQSLYQSGSSGGYQSSQSQSMYSKEIQKISVKLLASAELRNNLVKVFSYVLNQGAMSNLDRNLYEALIVIYNAIKIREIKVSELLPVVRKLSMAQQQDKYTMLFQELQRISPGYLQPYVGQWYQALQRRQVDITQFLRSQNGQASVDLFVGIPSTITNVINEPLPMLPNVKTLPNIESRFGKLIAEIFSLVTDESVQITPSLFASILSNIPVDTSKPNTDESLQRIVEGLLSTQISSWSSVVNNISPQDRQNPYSIVRLILQRLSSESSIPSPIREGARQVLPYISDNYPSGTPIFNKPMDNMQGSVFGSSTSFGASNFQNLIQQLLISQSKTSNSWESNLNPSSPLSGGSSNYQSSNSMSGVSNNYRPSSPLSGGSSNYHPNPYSSSPSNYQPSSLFTGGSSNYQSSNSMSSGSSNYRPSSYSSGPSNYQPSSSFTGGSSNYQSSNSMSSGSSNYRPSGPSFGSNSPSQSPSWSSGSYPGGGSPSWGLPGMPGPQPGAPSRTSGSDILSVNGFPLPTPESQLETVEGNLNFGSLLPPTKPGSIEDENLKPLRYFLSNSNLLGVLGSTFKPENYPNKGLLLRGVLKHLLKINLDQRDVEDTVRKYLRELENNQPSVTVSQVNYASLESALPPPTNADEAEKRSTLVTFLQDSSLSKTLGDGFNGQNYGTKGVFLKHLLEYCLQLNYVIEDRKLSEAIRYYLSRVDLDKYGSHRVEWVYVTHTFVQRTVDLNGVFRALDNDNLNKEARVSVSNLKRFFNEEFKPAIHMKGFNFFQYSTKGEWMTAFFNHVLTLNDLSPSIRNDFMRILPYIRMHGPGAEPVEFDD
uniref:Uncharacterized protein n=1 Tax=Timema cristinae TaxID=61476 RepID=A0A7R9D5B4_TIMCR|nr:unnamed protein product [Timema cristinae]